MEKKQTFIERFGWLVLAALVTIGLSSTSSVYLANRATRNAILENAAPRDYVDKQDNLIISHSDLNDIELKEELDKKAAKTRIDKLEKTLETIDSRIYDLWRERNK